MTAPHKLAVAQLVDTDVPSVNTLAIRGHGRRPGLYRIVVSVRHGTPKAAAFRIRG